MKLKILGKYGPYSKAGVGSASGYLVSDDGFRMLLDMGSGVLSRLIAEVDVRTLDGIFISHVHYDHTSDLLPFRYYLEEINHKIKIYTEKQSSEWYEILFNHPLFEIINVDENTSLNVKGKEITFARMSHPIPCLSIKIKGKTTFAYTGDTNYHDGVKTLLDGCDLAVVDCAKPKDFVGGHMTVEHAKMLKKETGVKTLIASHASPDYDPSEEFVGIDGLVFAEEGRVYDV